MTTDKYFFSRHYSSKQRGFALVAALFLIVVLAALGLFAVKISSSQQQSLNFSLLGSRAQAAANSGIEYAANRALRGGGICANSVNVPLTQKALNGFTVIISCTNSTHSILVGGAPTPFAVYELKAISIYSTYGRPDYVSRTMQRTVSNVPVP